MYDADTANLIRSVRGLEGLDSKELPDRLSQAFAEIAAARLRLRSGTLQDEGIQKLVHFSRRLALTHEALVSIAPQRENRAAAAFVSATAHQLTYNALRIGSEDRSPTELAPTFISSDIAAMLFLVAEATADASEVAARIALPEERTIERSLIAALRALAEGRLGAIIRIDMPSRERAQRDTPAESAAAALYWTLLRGVYLLANRLLAGSEEAREVESPAAIFERVKVLASQQAGGAGIAPLLGTFAGPFHLASLLIAVAGDLSGSAVVRIPPPTGLDPEKWRESLARMAEHRPFLWRNHRQAIDDGYLEPGTSSAIGFPTGAGKSTLAELKINTALLAGHSVIFLAPTHALIGQTATALRGSFPTARVQRERADEFGFATGSDELPDILVMTPEACLAQMSFDAAVFDGVGLLVFDECHLLHGDNERQDRRAIDAMLCILNFVRLAPQADLLLLSAMMKNTDAIAGWLASLTGRPCLGLSLPWKPTRQLRGSVVYHEKRLTDLQEGLRLARQKKSTGGVPVALQRQLKVEPLGFFSLQQTWASQYRKDYALLPFLDEEILLGANKYWKLTPNSGVVAATLASAAAEAGIKTLVFFQTIRNAKSAADKVSERLGQRRISLTEEESRWLSIAVLELGDVRHLFLDIDGGEVVSPAAVHHGLLLPEERQLVESLYKRPDGVQVLAATSTLAQGMNLPSEIVIIAEDSRFDDAKNKREVLEAQDLLNAAGRAGRAGKNANGVVIVIPGKVVSINDQQNTIGNHWSALQNIFGQSDQCLDIDDPLTAVLDHIQVHGAGSTELQRYCVARLASGPGSSSGENLARAVASSFGAYRARLAGNDTWLQSRTSAALALLSQEGEPTDDELASREIAATVGVPADIVSILAADIGSTPMLAEATVRDWRKWLFRWMAARPAVALRLFRPDSLGDLFGTEYRKLDSDADRIAFALPKLKLLMLRWMAGNPLSRIEQALGTPADKLGTCDGARKFVLRIVPELAYLFGLPLLILQSQIKRSLAPAAIPAALSQLGRCARLGLDDHEKAALNYVLRKARYSRIEIHARFDDLNPHIQPAQGTEQWEQTVDRIETAVISELNRRS